MLADLGRSGAVQHVAAAAAAVRRRRDGQEASERLRRHLLRADGIDDHRRGRGRDQAHGLHLCHDLGHDHRGQRHRGAGSEADGAGRDGSARRRDRAPVPPRPDHRRRAVQQGGRAVDAGDRRDHAGGQGLVESADRTGRDGDLRRNQGRHSADPPVGRHARPDGRPVGAHHRAADPLELP